MYRNNETQVVEALGSQDISYGWVSGGSVAGLA